jgi:DNA polymerase-3 subunit gamma/tau
MVEGLRRLDEKAPDYESVLEDVASMLQQMAVLQQLPGMDTGEEGEAEALAELASLMPPEDVQVNYQIAIAGRRDLGWAPSPRSGVEMTLLRMLLFRPEGGEPATPRPASAGQAPQRPAARAREAGPAAVQGAADGGIPAAGIGSQGAWESLLERLALRGLAAELMRHCEWVSYSGNVLTLRLDSRHQGLLSDDLRRQVEAALQGQTNPHASLCIVADGEVAATPAQKQERQLEDLRRRSEQSITSDPTVQALQNRFGAVVRPGSVEPLE